MSYKKLLMETKVSDEKILEIFIPYLTNKMEFNDRKDNDITLFTIIDTQEISKQCFITILKNMIDSKTITRSTIEYIINRYTQYNLNISEFYL
jgi:hypothetical protein